MKIGGDKPPIFFFKKKFLKIIYLKRGNLQNLIKLNFEIIKIYLLEDQTACAH
jgi:hypothetical protein